MASTAEVHTIESIEDFTEFAYANEWTDGLPVFPPTRKVVSAMLDYIKRDPQEVLGTVFPGDGVATIENVVANCAMAGCLPEYVPVVIAAVECIADPTLLITTTQSTGSASLCTIVSGSAVNKLKFHTREWIFGPNGGHANAAIGRAVRLILWNIGRAHPGKLIKGTMGHPASWSYCIGEERELSPWEPMRTDFGVAAGDSAVTVMKVGEHSQIAAPINTVGLNESITLLARNIGRLGITTSGGKRGFMFVLNPSRRARLPTRDIHARNCAIHWPHARSNIRMTGKTTASRVNQHRTKIPTATRRANARHSCAPCSRTRFTSPSAAALRPRWGNACRCRAAVRRGNRL